MMKYKVGDKLLCIKSEFFHEGRVYTIKEHNKETKHMYENIDFKESEFLFVPVEGCKFTHLTNLTKLLYLD